MNERAAISPPDADALLPIWHLDADRALFIGPLGRNALHAHSVPVLVAGLYASLRLRFADTPWQGCRAAVIPAGVAYEFDAGGSPLAVLYLEPGAGRVDTLVPFVTGGTETAGVLTGDCAIVARLRALYEVRDGARLVPGLLDEVLAFAAPRARRAMDGRVARAVAALAPEEHAARSAADAARAVGLSSSRFQHLFADEVGVPFRRFRGWQRLRSAIADIACGSSFTRAAHAAGFADQAHFSRVFRQTFGAPASPSLRRVRGAGAAGMHRI